MVTNVSSVDLSGLHRIDSLIFGTKWGSSVGSGVTLTYNFYDGVHRSGFKASDQDLLELTDTQRQTLGDVLNTTWNTIANVNFVRVSDSEKADIRFAGFGAIGNSYYPGGEEGTEGSTGVRYGFWALKQLEEGIIKGDLAYSLTIIHEIGHALGLKHPHDKDGIGVVAELAIDTSAYTVMSYRSNTEDPCEGAACGYTQNFAPTTPMLHDIAAIQYLYGANMETRKGNTLYQWAPGQQILETIWDAGGIDTIDWSNQSSPTIINLNEGRWSELGPPYLTGERNANGEDVPERRTLTIAYGVTIENAFGGAATDNIIGNSAANHLRGEAGNDGLQARDGDDTLQGGDGDDALNGGAGNDVMQGGDGNDGLDSGLGNDAMDGGLGNDTFFVESEGDSVTEYADAGIDNVIASINYTLGANLENLNLSGEGIIDGYGNILDNQIIGNSNTNRIEGKEGNDALYGATGNDTLSGEVGNDLLTGNSGDDWMIGGLGDDMYHVDSTGDTVAEYTNEGVDGVDSSIDYSLSANVENLLLNGLQAYSGFGNNLDNSINGNENNNYLDGGDGNDRLSGTSGSDTLNGGAGNDTLNGDTQYDQLYGGIGNDRYNIGSDGADLVIEYAGEGEDTVSSYVNYSLNANVEHLILVGDAANGYGNVLNNTITGSTADNYLYGADGTDTLEGQEGNDYLYGQSGSDSLLGGLGEDWLLGDAGNDSLAGGTGKDWLIAGLGDDWIIGEQGKDRLIGGAGDDTLSGGIGKDWLTGDTGADQFLFSTLEKKADIIKDFRVLDGDTIAISAQGFSKKLKIGKLSKSQFTLGSVSEDRGDRFIYDSFTGKLLFDADGTGRIRAVTLARLSKGLSLAHNDINIVA